MEGHEIIAKAFNGEEAIEIFKTFQNYPEIILMDHRMPLKNGLETTKEMISINSESKIIFVSADYTVKNKAFEIGAIDFLEKPIDLTSLIAMVEKYTMVKSEIT